MKQKIILFFATVFIFSFGAYTQYHHYYVGEYKYFLAIDRHDHLGFSPRAQDRQLVYQERVANNVKSSQKVMINHKEDTLHTTTTTYNKKGRIIALEKIGKKGKKFELKVNYKNDTLLTRYETKRKKKLEEITFKYNDEGKLIHLLHLKNGKKKYEINKTYKGRVVLESISIDYRKRNPRSYKSVNTVNEEGEVIKTTYYKNDKLKRVWEYDCSEKGTEVKSKKNKEGVPTSSSCSWKAESADGSYTFYYRTLNGKNINLFESHYDKDSVLLKTKSYDKKDRLKYEVTYNKNHKVNLWYKSNGKVKRHYTEVFDPNLGIVSTNRIYYGLRKTHKSIEKVHTTNGLLVQVVSYRNGKKSKKNLTYSYYY